MSPLSVEKLKSLLKALSCWRGRGEEIHLFFNVFYKLRDKRKFELHTFCFLLTQTLSSRRGLKR